VLHAIQAALGIRPEGAVPVVAQGLNLSRAEVHGGITFYHYFRRTPPGKHVVSLCRAEACQSMGADELAEHAKRSLGVDFHERRRMGSSRSAESIAWGIAPARRRRWWMAASTADWTAERFRAE